MKTYRIGMIGSENSHARAFAKAFCKEPGFADMQVTAVYGDEGIEKSQRVQEFFPDAVIVETPEQMLGLVDAVMITSRDGVLHYPYAKPFLDSLDTVESRAVELLGSEKLEALTALMLEYDRALQKALEESR